MTPTLETVFNQIKQLTLNDKKKIVEMLNAENLADSINEKRLKIRQFRGKFRHILPSTQEFLAERQIEIAIEETR